MRLVRFLVLAAVALVAAAGAQIPVSAQSSVIGQAIAAGEAGERYDGYMGLVGTPSAVLRRQVDAVNIRRRNLYIELATRRNLTAQLVGMATACQLLAGLAPGESYMLSDGTWRRHVAGQPAPVPENCR